MVENSYTQLTLSEFTNIVLIYDDSEQNFLVHDITQKDDLSSVDDTTITISLTSKDDENIHAVANNVPTLWNSHNCDNFPYEPVSASLTMMDIIAKLSYNNPEDTPLVIHEILDDIVRFMDLDCMSSTHYHSYSPVNFFPQWLTCSPKNSHLVKYNNYSYAFFAPDANPETIGTPYLIPLYSQHLCQKEDVRAGIYQGKEQIVWQIHQVGIDGKGTTPTFMFSCVWNDTQEWQKMVDFVLNTKAEEANIFRALSDGDHYKEAVAKNNRENLRLKVWEKTRKLSTRVNSKYETIFKASNPFVPVQPQTITNNFQENVSEDNDNQWTISGFEKKGVEGKTPLVYMEKEQITHYIAYTVMLKANLSTGYIEDCPNACVQNFYNNLVSIDPSVFLFRQASLRFPSYYGMQTWWIAQDVTVFCEAYPYFFLYDELDKILPNWPPPLHQWNPVNKNWEDV